METFPKIKPEAEDEFTKSKKAAAHFCTTAVQFPPKANTFGFRSFLLCAFNFQLLT
jgi:hypothetical protein